MQDGLLEVLKKITDNLLEKIDVLFKKIKALLNNISTTKDYPEFLKKTTDNLSEKKIDVLYETISTTTAESITAIDYMLKLRKPLALIILLCASYKKYSLIPVMFLATVGIPIALDFLISCYHETKDHILPKIKNSESIKTELKKAITFDYADRGWSFSLWSVAFFVASIVWCTARTVSFSHTPSAILLEVAKNYIKCNASKHIINMCDNYISYNSIIPIIPTEGSAVEPTEESIIEPTEESITEPNEETNVESAVEPNEKQKVNKNNQSSRLMTFIFGFLYPAVHSFRDNYDGKGTELSRS